MWPARLVSVLLVTTFLATTVAAQQPFPVISAVDEPEIAGRPVQLDAQGKLLPWPFADRIGESFASDFLGQWRILQNQFQGQRLPYFYCCFSIDPKTSEMIPDRNWANSTAYLRAMLEGSLNISTRIPEMKAHCERWRILSTTKWRTAPRQITMCGRACPIRRQTPAQRAIPDGAATATTSWSRM